MPRNDDGEFELVLGNRQLLTVFFLVITLLGVFFAMGFIMGRSGSSSTVAEMKKPDNAPTERPIVVDAGTGQRPAAAGAVVPPPVKPEPPKEEPVKVAEAKPEPAKPEPKVEAKKEEPKKPEPKKPEPPPPAPATGGAPAGTYLQVAAVKRSEAEIVSGLIAKRGYRAYLVPLKEGSDTFRVLVGPTQGRDQQTKMLEDLKAEGFKPFPRRI